MPRPIQPPDSMTWKPPPTHPHELLRARGYSRTPRQTQRCNALFALVEKCQPRTVFYEENASPDDVAYITDIMEKRGCFNLKDFRQCANDGSKTQRIKTLEPVFREGLVWFPNRLMYKRVDGQYRDLIQDFI